VPGTVQVWFNDADLVCGETLAERLRRRGEDAGDGKDELLRLMRSLWTFMRQRLCVRRQGTVERAERRRLERDGVQHVPLIEIVELRARAYAPADARGAASAAPAWSCRWVVRKHWHSYWVGCGQARRLEPQLVGAYVKGPPEKPLKTSAKLFAVVR
jgi:hypothetical protein